MSTVANPGWPRHRLTALLTSVTAVTLSGLVGALPAAAATVLTVNPGSIRAGHQVQIRATCGDDANPAFVHSPAFGSVTLVPSHGVLAEEVTVPTGTHPGSYPVNLSCASGQRSSADLIVIGAAPDPTRGPHTGGGEMAASTGGRLTLLAGLIALVAGVGLWLLSAIRRSPAGG